MRLKKVLWIFIIPIIMFVIIFIQQMSNTEDMNLQKIEYRTDVAPLINHFPILESTISVYWKSGTYGKSFIGPSDIWLKGYVLLDDAAFKNIVSKYSWHGVEILFEEGITPDITKFDSFEWYLSKDFSKDMNHNSFIGDFYLDKKNNILFFDLSTH